MIKNPYPGKFVSVDGIDGAGKSTQIAFIKKYFSDKGYTVFSGHEPTDGKFGSRIHDMLFGREKMPEKAIDFQSLYVEDRKEHLKKEILPSLKKDDSVYVADRYFLSTLAYGIAGGISFSDLLGIHEKILGDQFIVPDIMIIIWSDADIAVKRLKDLKGENLDAFEKKRDFLDRVGDAFLSLKDKLDNIYVVDGNKKIEEVSEDIKNILDKKYERI